MHEALKACAGLAAALIAGPVLAAASAPAAGGYHVVDKIPGPDGGWDYAAVDTVGGRLLVGRGDTVMVVDLATRAVQPRLAPGTGVHAALPINGGKQVLITNGGSDTVTIVDAVSGALAATLATGKGPDAAALDPSSGLVLVMDHTGGEVVLIDPKTAKVVGSIAIGGDLEAGAPDGAGKAYINIEDRSQVAVVDLKARKVLARYDLPGCEGPTGVAYVADQKLLIEACDGSAVAVNAVTGKVVKVIKIGAGADGVVYDAARKLAFVPSGRTGTLNVLSVKDGGMSLVETIPTQVSARTLALDPRSGRVYLPAAAMGPPAAGQQRPSRVPGSYVTLVVAR